jgi:hypothetical protein
VLCTIPCRWWSSTYCYAYIHAWPVWFVAEYCCVATAAVKQPASLETSFTSDCVLSAVCYARCHLLCYSLLISTCSRLYKQRLYYMHLLIVFSPCRAQLLDTHWIHFTLSSSRRTRAGAALFCLPLTLREVRLTRSVAEKSTSNSSSARLLLQPHRLGANTFDKRSGQTCPAIRPQTHCRDLLVHKLLDLNLALPSAQARRDGALV